MEPQELIGVLLVEDQVIWRAGIMLVLKRFKDMKVIGETDNGLDAVDKAASLHPDVILMDVSLRGISGVEATKRIKKEYPNIKIVALTSHEEESSILAAFAAGIDGYCPKGIVESELYEAIKTVCAGDLWLDGLLAQKVLRAHRPRQTKSSNSPPSLTNSEQEVFDLMRDGCDSRKISERLKLSKAQTCSSVRSVLEKIRLTAL